MNIREVANLMETMIEQMKVMNSSKQVMTVKDVALYLNVSESLIYKMTSQQRIRHYKPDGGRLVFFERKDVVEWALSHGNRVEVLSWPGRKSFKLPNQNNSRKT